MCSIHSFTSSEIKAAREALLLWYYKCKRDLPWRQMALDPDPNIRGYAVWVSEVMLQQTQVKTVIDYYNRWMKKWPNVQELASASLDDVNSVWSGLGYYSRARLLHEGAKKIVNECNGNLPHTAEALKSTLPGVGRYTAGAISSIAFNQCTAALDGNVIRVLTRLREIGSPVQLPTTIEYLWNLANQLVDPNRPGDFNQALMELGAVCCTPKQPNCSKCPINEVGLCGSFKRTTGTLRNKKLSKEIDVENCHLCIDPGLLAGLWEFPSYTIETLKSENNDAVKARDQCSMDDIQSFIPLAVEQIKKALESDSSNRLPYNDLNVKSIGEVVHIFSHIHMKYIVFTLKLDEKPLSDIMEEDIWPPLLNFGRWVSLEDLQTSAISTATKKIFAHFENYSKTSNGESVEKRRKVGKRHSTKTSLTDSKQSKLDNFFR
ncbi:unnamed protein product [Trichobilharzia szidati]|nr:unnamed protein product [Trichobilharzia szidati]